MQFKGKDLQRYFVPWLFIVTDYLAVVLAVWAALKTYNVISFLVWNDHRVYTLSSQYSFIWIPLLFLLFLGQSQSYSQMRPILDTVKDIFHAVVYSMLVCIVLFLFFRANLNISRLTLILLGVYALFFIYAFRYILLKLLKSFNIAYEPVILIGAGLTAEALIRFFDGDLGYRYRILGIIDDHPISSKIKKQFLLFGAMKDAEKIIKDSQVQTVLMATPGMTKEQNQQIINAIQPYVRNISFVPDLVGTPMASADLNILFNEKIPVLNVHNNLARRRNRIFKRIFDLVLTIVGGIMISPILLILAIIVGIDNHGHIIFAHQRVGKHGKLFPCYKFQTMIPNAQEKLAEYLATHPEAKKEWETNFKLEHDPRVTKLGAFLRKTSLDELPQIFNVLKGEMSLVGPRPIVQKEIPKYHEFIREYYMVRPGITGMWQASGRSDTTYDERVDMDTWYVRNWSVWVDLMYLFKTFKAVFTSKGAY